MAWGDDDPVVPAPAPDWGANDAPAQPRGLIDRVTSAITERPLQTAGDVARWVTSNTPQGMIGSAVESALSPSAPKVEHPDLETVANLPIPGALDPGMTFGKAMAAKFGPMFTSEPDEIERIILKNVPGTTATKDAMGNRMIDYQGKRYYIDMPGVTGMDVARAAGPAMVGIPLTAAAAAAAPVLGAGALGTAALIGGASGISSLAEDALADAAGGEGGLKAGKAALATLMGGGGQMLLGRVMPKLARQASVEGLGLDDIFSGGSLTDRGLALFKRAGVDPEMFTPQQLTGVVSNLRADMVDDAATQAIQQATRQQVAGDLRVPMTRGQITGDEAALIAEDQMRQGAKGTPAQSVIREFGENQGNAAETAVDSLRRNLTSAMEPMAPSDIGNAVGGAWERASGNLLNARDRAYQATFSQPGIFEPGAFRNTATSIQQRLSDPARPGGAVVLDDTLTPNAIRALEEIKSIGFGPRPNRAMTADMIRETPTPTPITMQELDRVRKVALAAKSAAYRNNAEDGRAASAVVGSLDDHIADAMKAGLFDGDQRTLDMLLGSRQLHTLWRQRFGTQRDNMGLVNGFISTAAKDGRSGQDLFNALYGAGQLGSRQGARAMMEHVTRVLGDNPEAMMALREGAINRILGGVDSAGGAKLTYGRMAKGIEQAMAGPGREVVDALFTGAERQQLQRMGYTLQTLADTMNRRNPSGTSYPLLNALRKMTGGGMGAIIGAVLGSKTGMPWAGEAMAAAGAGAGKLVQDQLAAMTAHRATNYEMGISRMPVSQWLRNAAALPAIEGPSALDSALPTRRASGGRVGFDLGGPPIDPLTATDRFGATIRALRAADTSMGAPYGPAPSLMPSSPYPVYYLPPGNASGASTAPGTSSGLAGLTGAAPSASAPGDWLSTFQPGGVGVAGAGAGPGTGPGSGPTSGVNSTSNSPAQAAVSAAIGAVSPVPGVVAGLSTVANMLANVSTIGVPGVATVDVSTNNVNADIASIESQTGNSVTAGTATGNNAGQPGQPNAPGQVANVGATPGIGVATQTAQQADVGGGAAAATAGVGVGVGAAANAADANDSGTWRRGGMVRRAHRDEGGRTDDLSDRLRALLWRYGAGRNMAPFGQRLGAAPASANVTDLRQLGPQEDWSALPPTQDEIAAALWQINGDQERNRMGVAGPMYAPETDDMSALGALLNRGW